MEALSLPLAPGAVVDAPAVGMRYRVLDLTAERYRVEVDADPGANGGPLHRHMHQSEHFEVLDGAMRVRRGLRDVRLVGPGEEITIPPARAHTFSIPGDGARFVATFTPPLRVPDYFLELFEIGKPGLRDLARLAIAYPDEHFYLPVLPPAAQRALLRPFASHARALSANDPSGSSA